jgi:hypothetical protein
VRWSLASLLSSQTSPWYDNGWINNGWIIGIVTGVVSGALLAAVTPLFLRRRRARDLAIRRDRAADDVLSALRPSVATGYLPSATTVDAIARASAYKRGLDPKYAIPASTIIDVLIYEVMVSVFLVPETRLSEANKLLELQVELDRKVVTKEPSSARNYRAETAIASLAGAATIGGVAAASSAVGSWVPVVSTLAVGLFVFLIFYFYSTTRSAFHRITSLKFPGAMVTFDDLPDFRRVEEISVERAEAEEASEEAS